MQCSKSGRIKYLFFVKGIFKKNWIGEIKFKVLLKEFKYNFINYR